MCVLSPCVMTVEVLFHIVIDYIQRKEDFPRPSIDFCRILKTWDIMIQKHQGRLGGKIGSTLFHILALYALLFPSP